VIDAFASLPHYHDHLRPIWDALPVERRGTLFVAGKSAKAEPCSATRGRVARNGGPVLVASASDARAIHGRDYVYVEHGAGQRYDGDPATAGHPSYSGGRDHDRCVLFLCPNELVAARWRVAYPSTPAVVVGSPRLDRWHTGERAGPVAGAYAATGTGVQWPTAAITFHWNGRLIPEMGTAWKHYDRELGALVLWALANGVRLLGHGHPRIWPHLRRRWETLGIEHTPDAEEVFEQADVLVADNTSLAYEFASLDRPVVVLNAPWYRREVNHGLRFWSEAEVGVQVDEPSELPTRLAYALEDPPAVAQRRREIVDRVLPLRDGRAAERAAAAIVEVLGAHQPITAA
jgi:hypothetical protein